MPLADEFVALLSKESHVFLRGPWAVAGRPARREGWKLHVSATPSTARGVVATVLSVLDRRVSFKVLRDSHRLGQMNEGTYGISQVGKFITIYPESDDDAASIAERIAAATKGCEGPVVITDIRLGDVTYARFGGFNPVVHRDRFGYQIPVVTLPDGTTRPDHYDLPSRHTHIPDGLRRLAERYGRQFPATASEVPSGKTYLLGPGYLLTEVLKVNAKGCVFRGLDVRSRDSLAIKVIKQARPHCMEDEHGRDARARLRHQGALHMALRDLAPVVQCDAYFEHDGVGYLPLEYVPGRTFETAVVQMIGAESWAELSVASRNEVLSYLRSIVEAIASLHAAGVIHRDITPANFWLTDDRRVLLLDLELAYRPGSADPPFRTGTPGFLSPQQIEGATPSTADDVYALGCLFLFALTGIDPRRTLFGQRDCPADRWRRIAPGTPPSLVELALTCLDDDPQQRPALTVLHEALASDGAHRSRRTTWREPAIRNEIGRLLTRARDGLTSGTVRDPTTDLWLSATSQQATGPVGVFELMTDANRGVAGVVYVLARLCRQIGTTSAASDAVRKAWDWLLERDIELPGLHFGRAGVAVALSEAARAGLIEKKPALEYARRALASQADWPDLTHGAAGQGIATLLCAEAFDEPALVTQAHRYVEYLLATQRPDGAWRTPEGVEGISGHILPGFAHGVAGIAFFLGEWTRHDSSGSVRDAWFKALEWLINHAKRTNGALEWRFSDLNPEPWRWWCHGSPGVALTFLQAFAITGNARYRDVARRALRALPARVRFANLSQCHGMSGLGEIYLEAAAILGKREWYRRAIEIAAVLLALRRDDGHLATWLTEDPNVPTSDLMVGAGGIVHFLLRMTGAVDCGPPLLTRLHDGR
ncbi:MAG TPA: lanthionine synthetase LanC family protein [Thermoanaerobaculia bacterium]|jgi:serine/threonine protein kinase